MNLFEPELRINDPQSSAKSVGQSFQPAGGNYTSSLPSSAEEGRAQARDDSPTPAPGWCESSHPLAPTLFLNAKNMSGEREQTVVTLTQGSPSRACRSGCPRLHAYAPLGLGREEAASCRFTNVQSLTSYAPVCPRIELNQFRFPSPQRGRGVGGEGDSDSVDRDTEPNAEFVFESLWSQSAVCSPPLP